MEIKKIKKIILLFACFLIAGFNYFVFAQNNTENKADTNIDSDRDGLTDAEEKLYATNPKSADTDEDGYSDGVEVKSGYDPLKKAPGDKLVTNTKSDQSLTTISDVFTENLKSFVENNDQKTITTTDLNTFVSGIIQDKMGPAVSFETLPALDSSKLKIKKQAYNSLSESEKKAAEKKDAVNYLSNLYILFISNYPSENLLDYKPNAILSDLEAHMTTLSSENPDYAYFRNLSDKLQLFIDQALEMEVPETWVDSHIKFLKILEGYIALKDPTLPSIENDPLTGSITLNKMRELTDFAGEFLNQIMKQLQNLK